ncbi:MAG: AAA family ATPase [Wohlfahrtiimonas sp.]
MSLKQLIKDNGINQAELARAVGVSPAAINQFVNHNILPKRNPDKFINKIGEYFQTLNITLPSDLFNNNENEDDSNMNKTLLTPKAKKLYGITIDPFSDDIRSDDDVFFTQDALFIKENLYQAAKNGGFIGIIGESGSGKTVQREGLIDRINNGNEDIHIIMPSFPDKTKLTVGSLIEAVIYELSPNTKTKRSQEAKAQQMEKLLRDSSRAGMSHCLIIEEAHDLTIPMLKNLKRFWEMKDGYRHLLSIILIGQPELKDKLSERLNYEAREVISRIVTVELEALGDDLYDYVIHKFKRINVDATKFITVDAIEALDARLTRTDRNQQKVSNAYPLVVNNHITHILNFGAEIGAPVIDAGVVKSA